MVSRPGVLMDPSETPSRIIIGLFGAEGNPSEHIALLGRVARAAQDPDTRARLLAAPSAADLVHVLLERDAALV